MQTWDICLRDELCLKSGPLSHKLRVVCCLKLLLVGKERFTDEVFCSVQSQMFCFSKESYSVGERSEVFKVKDENESNGNRHCTQK